MEHVNGTIDAKYSIINTDPGDGGQSITLLGFDV